MTENLAGSRMWLDFAQKAQDMLLIHNLTCPLYITGVMDGQVSVRTRQHFNGQ